MPNEEDKIKTGWKLSDRKGPRVPQMHGIKREGEAGLVLSWQWHNGKMVM